jgi:hypothetical protein
VQARRLRSPELRARSSAIILDRGARPLQSKNRATLRAESWHWPIDQSISSLLAGQCDGSSLMTWKSALHPQVGLHLIHVAFTSFNRTQIKIDLSPALVADSNFGAGSRNIIDVGSE